MKNLNDIKEVSTGLNVIKFYANWCGPCRAFAPIMESVANNVDDVNFYSVNTDERSDLAQMFNIRNLPSVVIVKEGQIVETFIGLRNPKEVTNIINKFKN
jgi:thioredoxin 1